MSDELLTDEEINDLIAEPMLVHTMSASRLVQTLHIQRNTIIGLERQLHPSMMTEAAQSELMRLPTRESVLARRGTEFHLRHDHPGPWGACEHESCADVRYRIHYGHYPHTSKDFTPIADQELLKEFDGRA